MASTSILGDAPAQAAATPEAPDGKAENGANEQAAPAHEPVKATPAADGNAAPADAKPEGEQAADPLAELSVAEDSPVAASLAEIKALAKEHGLSLDAAKAVLGLQEKTHAAYAEAFEAQGEEWAKATKADKDFGGDNLVRNLDLARRALSHYWSPEFAKEVMDSPYGNHPDFLKGLAKAAAALAEPSELVRGGPAASTQSKGPSIAKLFPNSKDMPGWDGDKE